jgi:two-component system nitrogen regulation response regulator NtrX
MIVKLGPTKLPVLIEGETGTGKELVALALHLASARRGRFVAFNVCAIPDSMFESTVFGHVRGAFTGATNSSAGFLAEADGGTAFLDEIATMDVSVQSKLLRALETGTFRPVGASSDRKSAFRTVAASNDALLQRVASGGFRADLAQRLSGYVLSIPPLRARRDDIPLLAECFLRVTSARACRFSHAALRVLAEYDWPGNVRELKMLVERAVVTCEDREIPAELVRLLLENAVLPLPGERDVFGAGHERVERQRIIAILRRHRGDTAAASRALGIHRSTLYRHLRRLGVRAQQIRLARHSDRSGPAPTAQSF